MEITPFSRDIATVTGTLRSSTVWRRYFVMSFTVDVFYKFVMYFTRSVRYFIIPPRYVARHGSLHWADVALSNASPPVGTPLRSRWPGTSATTDDLL